MFLRKRTTSNQSDFPSWLWPLIPEVRKQQINRLQGNAFAKTILVAPVPGEPEMTNNFCWCDLNAAEFFGMTELQLGVRPDTFLVLPTTFDGRKPVNANTGLTRMLIEAAAKSERVERFAVIGSDAFKAYFGFGRKPSMNALGGSTIFVQTVNYKPLFTFPDLSGLGCDPSHRSSSSMEAKRARFLAMQRRKELESLLVKFQAFLGKTKPKAYEQYS